MSFVSTRALNVRPWLGGGWYGVDSLLRGTSAVLWKCPSTSSASSPLVIFGPQQGLGPDSLWIPAQAVLPCVIIKIALFFTARTTTKKIVTAPRSCVVTTGIRATANDLRIQIPPNVVSDASDGSLRVFMMVLNSQHTCYSTTNLFISPAAHLSVGGCFCQQDTDVKGRLLHKRCLKCDYNQMCMQIISEAVDFADIAQMHAFRNALYVLLSGNKVENKPSLSLSLSLFFFFSSCQLVKKPPRHDGKC